MITKTARTTRSCQLGNMKPEESELTGQQGLKSQNKAPSMFNYHNMANGWLLLEIPVSHLIGSHLRIHYHPLI